MLAKVMALSITEGVAILGSWGVGAPPVTLLPQPAASGRTLGAGRRAQSPEPKSLRQVRMSGGTERCRDGARKSREE